MDAGMLVQALGWTLIDFVWQGALIAAAYALLRAGMRGAGPRLRLAVGQLALLAFALVPMAGFAARLSGAWAVPEGGVAAAAGGAIEVLATGSGAAGTWLDGDVLLATVVCAWLLGVLVLSIRGLRQWRSAARMSRDAEAAPAQWQATLDRLRERFAIGRRVALRFSAEVAAPMLVGWLKPVILLPAGLCMKLPREQVELLLAHELAHVRRLDYLANLLQIAIETLLFYHPAVHWVSRAVRHDRELCCDDLVTRSGGDRLSYARALLALAEQRQVPGTALAASGGVLLARIEHIVGRRHRPRPAPATAPANGVLVLAGVLLLATLGWRALAPERVAAVAAPLLPALDIAVPAPALEAARLAVVDLVERRATALRPALPAAATVADAGIVAPSLSPVPTPPPAAIERSVAAPSLAVAAPPPAASIPEALPAPGAAGTTEAPAAGAATAIAPIRSQAPAYPRRARMAGIEGSVTLSYRVDRLGRVVDARVTAAEPARVFDRAALEAIEAWRFAPGVAGGERFVQTFDFRLGEGGPARPAGEECFTQTGTRICRPAP